MRTRLSIHPIRILALCGLLCAMAHAQARYRVLVGYNQSAVNLNADILATIELAIEETNQAYINSNINVAVELAGAFFIPYTETGSIFTDQASLQNPTDGHMDILHTLRDRYAADIVIMLTDDNEYCGVVGDFGVPASGAFAIVDAAPGACITGNYSFAHEIGHLFGGRHNDDATTTPFAYGHGFCQTSQGWRDIMSRNTGCFNRQQFFSNPNQTFGNPAVARGTASFNDVARVHNERGATMGAFRAPASNLSLGALILDDGEFIDAIATSALSTSGTFTISAGAKARLRSNGGITLNSGFSVQPGAEFVEIVAGGQVLTKQAAKHREAATPLEPPRPEVFSFLASVAQDRLSLRYTLPTEGPMRLEALRPDGKVVATHAWQGKSPGLQNHELPLRLAPREGLLLLRISGPGGKMVRKVFVGGR